MMNQPEAREAMAAGPAPPAAPGPMLIAMAGVVLAVAAWGCASTVAVIKLKRWGRTSFLVFGGLLVAYGGVNTLAAVMLALMSSAPPAPNVPASMFVWLAGAMMVVSLAIVAVGTWWLILFNRPSVTAQFTSPGASQPARQRLPIRIHVMAWMLLCSVVTIPLVLFSSAPLPVFLFGFELTGALAPAVLVVQSVVAVTAGIGLLRRYPRAHALAVGLLIFGLMNGFAIAAWPGGFRRVLASYRPASEPQVLPLEFFDSTMTFMMSVSLIVSVLLLALLVSARAAYLRACSAPAAV